MINKISFFTDKDRIIIPQTMTYGEIDNNHFRVCNVHEKLPQIEEALSAYAVCKSDIFYYKDSSDPNADDCTIILRPKGSLQGLPVRYFIYRKVSIGSVLGLYTAMKWDVTDSQITNEDVSEENFYIETLFKHENIDFFEVNAGDKIGEFCAEASLEIMLFNTNFEPRSDLLHSNHYEGIQYSCNADHIIYSTEKEKLLNYMDPAAFYGYYVNKSIICPNASPTPYATPESIYNQVLSVFNNKNRIYLDIRNEEHRAFNYGNKYGLYGNIRVNGQGVSNTSWPIFIINNPIQLDGNGKTILSLELPMTSSKLATGEQVFFLHENTNDQKNKFSKLESNGSYSKSIVFGVVSCNDNNSNLGCVASYIKLMHINTYSPGIESDFLLWDNLFELKEFNDYKRERLLDSGIIEYYPTGHIGYVHICSGFGYIAHVRVCVRESEIVFLAIPYQYNNNDKGIKKCKKNRKRINPSLTCYENFDFNFIRDNNNNLQLLYNKFVKEYANCIIMILSQEEVNFANGLKGANEPVYLCKRRDPISGSERFRLSIDDGITVVPTTTFLKHTEDVGVFVFASEEFTLNKSSENLTVGIHIDVNNSDAGPLIKSALAKIRTLNVPYEGDNIYYRLLNYINFKNKVKYPVIPSSKDKEILLWEKREMAKSKDIYRSFNITIANNGFPNSVNIAHTLGMCLTQTISCGTCYIRDEERNSIIFGANNDRNYLEYRSRRTPFDFVDLRVRCIKENDIYAIAPVPDTVNTQWETNDWEPEDLQRYGYCAYDYPVDGNEEQEKPFIILFNDTHSNYEDLRSAIEPHLRDIYYERYYDDFGIQRFRCRDNENKIREDYIAQILVHEFGHLLYKIENPVLEYLWACIESNYKNNGGIIESSEQGGHLLGDPSGILACEYEIQYKNCARSPISLGDAALALIAERR
ncbi:hypothetical protein LJC53_04680 [Bacteroidales bacterium OttesenSCG-928-C03]|nr:hypothetical protein [Bacteroidales bacterium OttesenSCG-928-C03]MDL2325843.1 hypothetical protein [Bacteroidales bacterium OttesenSCG-928-A14]